MKEGSNVRITYMKNGGSGEKKLEICMCYLQQISRKIKDLFDLIFI